VKFNSGGSGLWAGQAAASAKIFEVHLFKNSISCRFDKLSKAL